MNLLLVRHLWGVDLSKGFGPHLARWHNIGYQALECSPRMVPDARELRRVLRDESFAWVPQIFSNMGARGDEVDTHLRTLREQIEECLDGQPLFFNAQSGSDAWTLNQAEDFYGAAARMGTQLGAVLSHETHRSRYFGNPWNTYRLLQSIPDVKLTADFSHWVCVAERLLGDANSIFLRVARNCHHLHARVGYEQGPQVPDPRAPEWRTHLETHEHWWEMIWSAQQTKGMDATTLTPEFGPPPYLHTLPFTQKPAADLGGICDWMARREADRFAAWSVGPGRREDSAGDGSRVPPV
jgi:hypothetical protein